MSWRRLFYPICATRPGHFLAKAAFRALRACGLCARVPLPLAALRLDHAAVAGLTCLWSRIHWAGEDGMMPPEQLLAIYNLAVRWPIDGVIVELGAWKGLTTSYLAAAQRVRGRGHVYAVDTFQGTKEGGGVYGAVAALGGSTLPVFRNRIERAGLEAFVTPLVGWSHEVAQRYRGEKIRLLLIDADHSYEGVKRDYACWQPFVAPGGLVVFHDYAMAGVRAFVDGEVIGSADVDATPGPVAPNVFAVTKRTGYLAPRPRCEGQIVECRMANA